MKKLREIAPLNEIHDKIHQFVNAHPFGKASHAKRGRNPEYPHVPIIDHGEQQVGIHRTRTEQVLGKAFKTSDEAKKHAQKVIDARREHLRKQLAEPRMRALRRQHGLPEEI